MPLPNDKSSRRRHQEASSAGGSLAAAPKGFLSLRNVALGVFVVLGICSFQFVLLLSHTDPAMESHGQNTRLWHHLGVHEANLTALAYQQRELAKLLGQLNTAVIGQQKELHEVENQLETAPRAHLPQVGPADTALAMKMRELNREHAVELEAQRKQINALQGTIQTLLDKQPSPQPPQQEQVMHQGVAVDTSSLATQAASMDDPTRSVDSPPQSASSNPAEADRSAPATNPGDLPQEWLKRFSRQELQDSAQEAEKWRKMARDAAAHAWKGYKERAWGLDEMKPVTGSAGRVWGSCGLQILDALSTLWLMDLKDQFNEGAQFVENQLRWDHNGPVSFFEITIRALGGLASAHALSGREVFLRKARELADKLLPGFNAQTGFPMTQVNMKTGTGQKGWFQGTVLAEAGTVQLEFRYISQQTGDPKYAAAADKAMHQILKAENGQGLVPWGLSNSGPPRPSNQHITFGAMGDSYYEYLLKMYLQTDSTEPEWKDAWRRAMDKMMERLIFTTRGGLTYIAEEKSGRTDHKMDHLACFVGGMLIYGARELKNGEIDSRWEKTAEGITQTCYEMYHRQPSHLAAEASALNVNGGQGQDLNVWNNAAHYLLRPEAAEAIFYMFYYTGDPKYRRWAGEIMEAIERHCRTTWGYSAVADVRRENPSQRNEMETFFIAETLKYLYLTFVPNPRTVLNFDEFVLTTEAHPLRILKRGASNRFSKFLGK